MVKSFCHSIEIHNLLNFNPINFVWFLYNPKLHDVTETTNRLKIYCHVGHMY